MPGAKDWDRAIIFIRGRQPIGVDPNARYGTINEDPNTFFVEDNEAVDPFYNPQVDGPQPKICTHTITCDIGEIVAVDYFKYPRIIASTPMVGILGKA